MQRRRFSLIALLIVAALVVGLSWTIYATIRQERLNRALIASIKQNDTKMVLNLLAQGADPNARDEPPAQVSLWRLLWHRLRGRQPAPSEAQSALLVCLEPRPLSKGVFYRVVGAVDPPENPTLLKGLLDRGANVNVTDVNGRTPLLLATMAWQTVKGGRDKTIQLLLDYGANPNPVTQDMSPLEWAIRGFYTKEDVIAKMINRGANINFQDYNGDTPLFIAIDCERTKVIELLLDHHADLSMRNRDGETPLIDALHWQACRERNHIIHLLLEQGASVNVADKSGNSPLIWADDEETCLAFIQRGADVNVTPDGDSPFVEAVEEGNLDKIKLLLQHGADVNHKGRRGYTPLKTARMNRDQQTIQILKQAGAKE